MKKIPECWQSRYLKGVLRVDPERDVSANVASKIFNKIEEYVLRLNLETIMLSVGTPVRSNLCNEVYYKFRYNSDINKV
jgi:hypothetical protein